MAGLAGRCQSLALGGSRPHPDRYGRRREFAAEASWRPAHRTPRRRLLAYRMRSPPFSCPQCGSRAALRRRLPPTRSRARTRGACVRTPYRLRNRPAARRCGMIRPGALVAGLAGRCQSLALGGSRPHPERYGHRRSFAAAASCRPAHLYAASQAPSVPDALAAAFHVPSVAAAPLRADGCHAHCHGLTRAARAKARHTGRQRFPHGRFGMIKPSARVAAVGRTVRSPPLVCRRGITSASASEPRKSRATKRQAVSDSEAHADVFIFPVWQPRRIALTAATGIATGSHARRCFASIRYGNGSRTAVTG